MACEKGLTARVLVQVNASGEKTKSGLHPQEVEEFVAEASSLPGLEICGLMTIAPWTENPEEVRPVFRQVKGVEPAAAAKPAGQNGLPVHGYEW